MNVLILGAGRSGLAAAKLAIRIGGTPFVSEFNAAETMSAARQTLREHGIAAEFGGHLQALQMRPDLVVASPGIPPQAEVIRHFERTGIPIISELEYAWRHLPNRSIAVTGTNGKTTCTSLIAAILTHAGLETYAAGNIGLPLSDLAGTIPPSAVVVIETSSYQLDRIDRFCPDVAVILNLTPDHLSYHGDMDSYRRAKYKIFSQQSSENVLISGADDAHLQAHPPESAARQWQFGLGEVNEGAFVREGQIVFRFSTTQQQQQPAPAQHVSTADRRHKEEVLMPSSDIGIPGVHNLYNSMAAALAARAFEVRNEDIRDCLMGFTGVEHRLESVRTIAGVEFVNDSKATNVNACWYALGSYDRPLIWIAGGRGDGNDYAMLDELVRRNVRTILSIGEESRTIFNHFSSMTRCVEAPDLNAAVLTAMQLADPADIVLFSPACKSFDMFLNFEERGNAFKQAVNNLA